MGVGDPHLTIKVDQVQDCLVLEVQEGVQGVQGQAGSTLYPPQDLDLQ